ncbi:MAG: hypothetical protein ACOC0B_02235 [bacterium]
MDVDKEKIAVALVQDYEDRPRMERIIRNRADAIAKFFGEVTGRYEQVLACYEAGACGFELHRRVTAAGPGCMVAAPASMPKKANDRVKTDRRDARKLAAALRNGDLKYGVSRPGTLRALKWGETADRSHHERGRDSHLRRLLVETGVPLRYGEIYQPIVMFPSA